MITTMMIVSGTLTLFLVSAGALCIMGVAGLTDADQRMRRKIRQWRRRYE